MSLLPYFEALEASPIGVFVKDKAATFAIIEAMHLMALAVLGGSVLAADLRLLGVALRDVPSNVVSDNAAAIRVRRGGTAAVSHEPTESCM